MYSGPFSYHRHTQRYYYCHAPFLPVRKSKRERENGRGTEARVPIIHIPISNLNGILKGYTQKEAQGKDERGKTEETN